MSGSHQHKEGKCFQNTHSQCLHQLETAELLNTRTFPVKIFYGCTNDHIAHKMNVCRIIILMTDEMKIAGR